MRYFLIMLAAALLLTVSHISAQSPSGRIEMLKKQLNLSEVQTGSIQKILENSRQQMKQLREENKNNPEALQKAEADLRDQEQLQIQNILTDEQKATFAEVMEKQQLEQRAPRGGFGEERLEMLKKELALTDEQVTKIQPVIAEYGEKIRSMRQPGQRPSRDDREKMRALMTKQDEAIAKHLTAEQQATFKKMNEAQRNERRAQRPFRDQK